MKNPLELFPPYRKRKDKQRDDEKARRARIKIANNLFRLWNQLVKFEDDSYIDQNSLDDLNIKYEDLIFNEDGLYETTPTPNFFQPSTKEYLRGLTLDTNEEETKYCLKNFHDDWIINKPLQRPPYSQTFCYWLRDWFQCILWERPGENESVSLKDLSEMQQHLEWRSWEHLLWHQDEPFYSVLFCHNRCNPFHAWFSDGKPHIIMTMANRLPSDDRILVVEILAFVAVMWNRLVGGDLYPEHNVVPMMIFTFSNDQRGRILQACYDSERLVIRKSKLYDFTTQENCTKNMELFLQQLTCSLEGRTRILDVDTTHPKTPRTIKAIRASRAAKASGATNNPAARNDSIASNTSKASNEAIVCKDFATSNTPSGSDNPDALNDTAISNSLVAANAPSDPNASNDSNDLGVSNSFAAPIASDQPIASDAADGSNASNSRSSSSTRTSSSNDASKPTESSGTPDTSFSSDLPDPQASANLPETSILSKRKRSAEESR